MIREITVQELKKLKDENASFFLLDVREQSEYDICHLDGHLIPLNTLPQRLDELDQNQHIIVHCKMGGRSGRAVEFLQQHGFNNAFNLKGGIITWINEIDSSMQAY
jgi:rhodanese-related sulfurtransferase